MDKFIAKAPGKLMMAGEYAITEEKQTAIVMAVNRYLTVEIQKDTAYRIYLEENGDRNIEWNFRKKGLYFKGQPPRFKHLRVSLEEALLFLQEKKVKVSPFSIRTYSDLKEKKKGVKYGLGSSAAVTVAVIKAVLGYAGVRISNDELLKRSLKAHRRVQSKGSGADVAAAVYGGIIAYSHEMIDGNNYVDVHPLKLPENLEIQVGWTQKAMSTARMLKRLDKFKQEEPEFYAVWLEKNKEIMETVLEAFISQDSEAVLHSIYKNRRHLLLLDEKADLGMQTKSLRELVKIADRYGVGKISGAGGGDCGIAWMRMDSKADVNRERLRQQWKVKKIIPLDLIMALPEVE